MPLLENSPNYIVNIDDLSNNFWKHDYVIFVTAHGISFLVNADHAQDALDMVMDYIVDNGLSGLYCEQTYGDTWYDEYLIAGNHGYSFTTHNINIIEL